MFDDDDIRKGFRRLENQSDITQWDKEIAQLVSSLTKKEDIELKTEINHPMEISQLKLFGEWAENKGFIGSKKLIDDFIIDYLKNMVSYQRKGRIEIVKAISSINDKMKMTLMGRKNDDNQ